MRSVVITGIGMVSSLGNCKECFWNGMLKEPAPFQRVTRFDTDPMLELYAAEVVDFEIAVSAKPQQVWSANRSIQFAIGAAQRALTDAAIAVSDTNRADIGVAFGSTRSCLDIAVKVDVDGITRGPRTVNPMMFPHSNPSAPSCRVSLQFGLQAFNTILSNGATSGLDAIHYGAQAIREGLAEVVLAGGVEELTRMAFLFHQAMEELAPKPISFAPFSAKGIILGEGCAVLVLEEANHARSRGAKVLAEVAGYGSCFWPGAHFEENRSEAPEYAMRSALGAADLQPGDVDVVFASANGDPLGDRFEAAALRRTVPSAPIAAVKAQLGETHSAAGALHAAACVLTMGNGIIPAAVTENARSSLPIRTALINCFSTSRSTQTNSSLVLKSCQTSQ